MGCLRRSDNSGYVSLTDAAAYQRGALVVPDFAQGSSLSGFRLDLKVRVGGGSANPGDGFSINFARAGDPVLTDPLNNWATGVGGGLNQPEEGTATGLGIGFDAWPDTTSGFDWHQRAGGQSTHCSIRIAHAQRICQ